MCTVVVVKLHEYVVSVPLAPNRTGLQNIYSRNIVSWMAKSAELIMNLYKCRINLDILKIFFNKYLAIFKIMHIANQWKNINRT